MELLTESEVERGFRRLFRGKEVTTETLERAEALIDQLRSESPLRFRLNDELDELRDLCLSES